MKTAPFLFFICSICAALSTHAQNAIPGMLAQEEAQELIVYNRILAKVNGKTISVIDVMKKMDLFLQRYYPQYTQSKAARFQYYSTQWRDTLAQMIDQELMQADAEHLELKVSDAEVREEMLDRFGPAIIQTLDQIGMTYEEARKMVFAEMVVQRIMWYRVNSKALNSVNPQDIKEGYKKYCESNPALEEWEYQVLSLRSTNQSISELLAKKAADLLHSAANTDLATVSEQIKAASTDENPVTINLSPDLKADEKSIAQSHKDVLKTLLPGMFSPPIAQVSRADQSTVYRIFYLKNHSKKEIPPFQKMSDQIKEELLHQAAARENSQYIAKLRERLGYDEKHMMESLPPDFQPFALR
ncbi:MAG: SurA N-terminal domain-containing protein [Verrucomicrobia bacterium]|nr:SurA N-terminal domain-containing protein [Verrucomicrobiota bacterium]